MMEALINEGRLKELLKETLIEVIEERKDVLYELLAEVIEDIALARAIREGEGTEPVSRQDISELLEDQT
ncbi:MAG: hypothetical protein KatS3mg131_3102 [Candidatus Tectimicrobiota bacterium]|nr:MAG: hypothetical protein KatS3mg131_3102 [Candidatus Tectomicrobia bacterium]